MSGGQQQRVALARALVNHPTVLLLDEPLGALDLKLRKEMQLELKALQREVGITFVYVTHDQEEALTMSDVIVVMRDGRIQQQGGPTELYERPVNRFVADFIGTSNFIDGDVVEASTRHRRQVDRPERARPDPARRGRPTRRATPAPGDSVTVAIRPERLEVVPAAEAAAAAGRLDADRGRVHQGTYLGDQTEYRVDTDAGGRARRPPPERDGRGEPAGHRAGRPGRRALAGGGEPHPRGLRSDDARRGRGPEEAST